MKAKEKKQETAEVTPSKVLAGALSKLFFELRRYGATVSAQLENVIVQTRIVPLMLRDFMGRGYLLKHHITEHVDGKEHFHEPRYGVF